MAVDTRPPVLLIQPGALGDSILTLAVADQLRRTFPASPIEMLGHLDYIRLFPGRSAVTAVSDIDTAPLHTLFTDPPADLPPAFADYLHRFSAVISWLGQPDTPYARNLSSAIASPVHFIDRGPPPDYPHHVTHYWLTQLDTLSCHCEADSCTEPHSDNCFDLGLGSAGWKHSNGCHCERSDAISTSHTIEPTPVCISLSDHDLDIAGTRLSKLLPWPTDSTDYFVFHPGAGSPDKCWPIDSYVQLTRMIRTRNDCRVVFLIGPAERERFGPDALATLENSAPVLSDLDITSVAALICGSRGFLGHDSGPTHLAAALGLPTSAIFGPTNPLHWQPLGPAVRVICPPPASPQLSLDTITVDRIYQTIIHE